jgi:formylmethanofuran dehydrogenase subunit E
MNIPDNYDLWKSHQAAQDRAEANLPTCCECGHTIYEESCYEIEGDPICDDCMYDNHRKSIEYFM